MFLCKECHPENINPPQVGCDFQFKLNISVGRCESCKETKPCVDCHVKHNRRAL